MLSSCLFAGFCFQFNSDGKFNATSAGIQGGLALAIYADVMQYTMGPLSHAEGFSVSRCNDLMLIVRALYCDC